LAATCADVVSSMPDQVELLRGGKTRLMGLFVGEVMKRTKGRADPRRAAEIIKSLVDQ
jgi:aspartyl-tRNA(Asn)/glutamyl-tRNA(Gln) amidotransferase subunit B